MRSRSLQPMRRLLVLTGLLVALHAVAAVAVESPPAPGQGINVIPDKDSSRKSESGELAELGTVQVGQTLRDAVLVRSSLNEPKEILLYAADAEPAVGGGFGFAAQDATQRQVGSWLRLVQTRLTVPAGGTVKVPYSLTVPSGTEGGEYVGAVVAEPVDEPAAAGVQTTTRFAMAVYLRVPGGQPGATPGRGRPDGTLVLESLQPKFDGKRVCPVVTYRNDSQDIVDPKVSVRTKGLFGGSSYETPRGVGALLPGASAAVALPCLERAFGPGHVDVELISPQGGGRDSQGYTWLPWPFVLSLLLLLLLVGALLTTFLRGIFRRRSDANEQESDEPARA